MTLARIQSIRLSRFKSYTDSDVELQPLSIVVGRNGSGKSNALDALALLALLAEKDVAAVDGAENGIRGGTATLAPYGEGTIAVGCIIALPDGTHAHLDVEISAERPEILSERLVLTTRAGKKVLLESKRTGPGLSDASVYSGRQPKGYPFLSSRLATAQAITKVPSDNTARRLVVDTCTLVLDTLTGVFVLDPVPSRMREYVRVGSQPDRYGANLSAVLYALKDDTAAMRKLHRLMNQLVEADIHGITFAEAKLANSAVVDVMVALVEHSAQAQVLTADARIMSDGSLRYLCIAAVLLYFRRELENGTSQGRTVVIEEVENGLFPSQAEAVLSFLRDQSNVEGMNLLVTTHSPALLDALLPTDHAGVIVCERDETGMSSVQRLVDHPRYVDVAARGAIGRAVSAGELTRKANSDMSSLSELFGT